MGHPKLHSERRCSKNAVQRARLVCGVQHEVPFKKREEVRNFKPFSWPASKRIQDVHESEVVVGDFDANPVQTERPQEEDHRANLFSTQKAAVHNDPVISSSRRQKPCLRAKMMRGVPQRTFKCSKGRHSSKPISAFRVQRTCLDTSSPTSIASTSRSCNDEIPYPSSDSPQCMEINSVKASAQCKSSLSMDSSPTARICSEVHQKGVDAENQWQVDDPHPQGRKGLSVDNNKGSPIDRREKKFNCHPLIERLKCIMEVTNGGLTIDQACDKYEISARTFYRWKANKEDIARFVYDGENSICEDAKRKKYPDRQVSRHS